MFWARIIGNELVGPFRVPGGVKMNALTYRNFIQIILFFGTAANAQHSGRR